MVVTVASDAGALDLGRIDILLLVKRAGTEGLQNLVEGWRRRIQHLHAAPSATEDLKVFLFVFSL
jgi:hypothetical protein